MLAPQRSALLGCKRPRIGCRWWRRPSTPDQRLQFVAQQTTQSTSWSHSMVAAALAANGWSRLVSEVWHCQSHGFPSMAGGKQQYPNHGKCSEDDEDEKMWYAGWNMDPPCTGMLTIKAEECSSYGSDDEVATPWLDMAPCLGGEDNAMELTSLEERIPWMDQILSEETVVEDEEETPYLYTPITSAPAYNIQEQTTRATTTMRKSYNKSGWPSLSLLS